MRSNWFRRPKGYKTAAIKKARSIPPTSWEDIGNKSMLKAYDYAKRLFTKVQKFSIFEAKFRLKFPKWNKEEIRRLFYYTKC